MLRNGARALLAQAVEVEVATLLEKHADEVTDDGRRRLVRHGHLPEREIMTGIGPVAVRCLGLEMVVVKAGSESEIESAIVAAVQQQANALSMGNDAYLSSRSRQIAFFALRHALPTMSESREGVAAGLLMSYGPNQADSFRQAGLYAGRILKGEKPADLPVMQPTRFELFINLTTARAVGLKIPESFLLRAEVIE